MQGVQRLAGPNCRVHMTFVVDSSFGPQGWGPWPPIWCGHTVNKPMENAMRVRWLGFVVLGLFVLTGCTIQFVVPESSESQAPSGITSTVTAESTTPIQVAEDPSPAGPSAVKTADEVRQCPGSIELPVGIDPRACGPVPDDAVNGGRGERFITPSGNIACLMSEGTVMCEAIDTGMIEDFHNPQGNGECNGFVLSGAADYLCHSEAALWDGWEDDPSDWPELPYGDIVFVYEHVCTVEDEGLTCWNSETGHGFFVSRSRYTHW